MKKIGMFLMVSLFSLAVAVCAMATDSGSKKMANKNATSSSNTNMGGVLKDNNDPNSVDHNTPSKALHEGEREHKEHENHEGSHDKK